VTPYLRRFLLFAVLNGPMLFHPAHASVVVVPDDYGTIQEAIDSGADTVLVQDGAYGERPVVDRPLRLQGTGPGRPQLDGLDIFSDNFFGEPRLFAVAGMHFTGRVTATNSLPAPRNLIFTFNACALDSGFVQLVSMDPDDIAKLIFGTCHIKGNSSGRADQIVMEADTVDGTAAWTTSGDISSIRNCWFTGSAGTALELFGAPSGTAANNHIEHYSTAFTAHFMTTFVVNDNVINDCGTGLRLSAGDYVYATHNDIRNCNTGIFAGPGDSVYIRNNTVLGASSVGILARQTGIVVENNVVGNGGGSGVRLEFVDAPLVRNNTLYNNASSGVEATDHVFGPITVTNNIAANNGAWGLRVPPGQETILGCNDWFNNALGAVEGTATNGGDLAIDPQFCDVAANDVSISTMSGLVDTGNCGPIGALGVGCGQTATLIEMFRAEAQAQGIDLYWRFGAANPPIAWVERSPGRAGPWQRVDGTPVAVANAYRLSDYAVDTGATYWYRVTWSDGREVAHSTPLSVVMVATVQLSRVLPNPSFGRVSIQWTQRADTQVDIRIFDLVGREVAAVSKDRFPAGKHSISWAGRRSDGQVAPAGWYVARIAGNGVSATHMFLLLH